MRKQPQIEEEIWQRYDEYYEVSNLGGIKSLKRKVQAGKFSHTREEKILKFSPNSCGYFHVKAYKGDATFGYDVVHRMVAKLFIPNPKNLPFVNHINGDKTDNRAVNLQWCTQAENVKHAYDNNLIDMSNRRGEKSRTSVLTEKQVLEIREKRIKGISSLKKLAIEYGVAPSNISSILSRNTWKHI